jgi:hypothetical protein
MNNCLDERFKSFNEPIYNHFKWTDPSTWAPDRESELNDLKSVAGHLEESLQASDFKIERLKQEWKELRLTVQHKFSHLIANAVELWTAILKFQKQQFHTVCQLIELVLSIGVSNAVVESGFSRLTHLLSDRRLSMNHETMEAMLLQANDSLWTEHERSDIIEMALQQFLRKRRKRCMEPTTASMFSTSKCASYLGADIATLISVAGSSEEPQEKQQRMELSSESDDEEDGESDDFEGDSDWDTEHITP